MRASYSHFTQVDVFTTRPLAGNPLAVFHDGRGFSASKMQAIAREMNLAETTFVLPPTVAHADARVRIFTVTEELPFAGHPTLGTAFVVAKGRTEIRLQMKAGVIPVRRQGSYLEMRQNDPVFGSTIPRDQLAPAIGLSSADLDPRVTPQVVSTGLPFLIVPLRTEDALSRLHADYSVLLSLLRRCGGHFPYYLVTGEDRLQARMFSTAFEDPGTGSAAGCAAAFLVRYGLRPPNQAFKILQGRGIHRPCQITAQASLSASKVDNVRVGGHVVTVLTGRLA
jgi:trans-2,3-dihydro-3-hydroxyanthranilate isomerase